MKKKNILIFLCFVVCACFAFPQQVNTDNSFTPQQLIQNLVGSDCATATNVSTSINGSVNNIISYGSFNSGASNFPLENGIVLSTGSVTSAGNTLNGENLSEGEINWATDSDILDVLGIDQTLNATSIEFDFASANNFVSFKYLFASDEYQQDYPCNFRDVFAILIKRAGTADPYVNIALVPDTVAELSTNSIRPEINGFCEAENEEYFQGYTIGDTNFNGRTRVLTAATNIIPNEVYHIKFVIADHIDERFDSAVFIDAEGFGSSIDLGPDQSICGSDITLDATINNTSAIYTWFLNSTPITGETDATLEVNQSGSYSVEISIPSPSGNCILTDTIEIEIIPFQPAAPIDGLSICDPAPSDGLFDFDFPLLKNDEILENLPSTNYSISYHLTENDAQSNTNPILGLYQNTEETETIFVRIESLNGDCLQIGSFTIEINSSPNTLELTLEVCNEIILADFSIYGLESLDFPVSNYEFNTTVTYYLTEEDALNAINPLNDFPDLESEPPLFFARVEDLFNDCPSVVPINFEYQQPPDIDTDRFVLSRCVDPEYFETDGPNNYDYDSVVLSYNIQDLIDMLQLQYPDMTIRLQTFIPSVPPIVNTNVRSFEVDLGFSDGDYCELTVTLELHKNILYNVLGEEITIDKCDDDSNDGIVDFDLSEIINDIIGDDYVNMDLALYETEEDMLNETNAIDVSVPYTVVNNKELFIASTFVTCTHNSKLILNILQSPDLLPQNALACGDYNAADDTTTIFLEQFNDIMIQGLQTIAVDYYLTEEDAINEMNKLEASYAISGNTQRFYVKIYETFPKCADITTLDVTIPDSIELNDISPIVACDDNLDGIETVDLQSIIPELIDNPQDYNISFHTSSTDAITDTSELLNPNVYTTETIEIFVRVELPNLDCFAVNSFDVIVVANPQLNTVSDFINCEIDPNVSSDFFLVNKDVEVINNQQNMQVRYFETEDNANNLIDEIDKNLAYQNTSNPQTIYVRLENEAQNSCYKIAPMQLEVKQAPIYNAPSDVFECDINSTGLASTDLSLKFAEINPSNNPELSISFHLTPLNAEVGANAIPLNYVATSNPQLIYTRVVNINSGCVETPTFYINTLSLPEVNFNQSLIECGNNYNFTPQWDLTTIELQIIEGRQYGIDFTFFESEADLFADTNAITNPETYNNTSNPQTIYLKVRNTVTSCFASVPFELILNPPPQINAFETYNICDNETNSFNLLDINSVLLDNTFNVLVSYYDNMADAEAKLNPLNTDYTYGNNTENLFVRAEFSTTGCYIIYPFTLTINPLPVAHQPNDLIACDNDFDGVLEFDLAAQNNAVLNSQNPDDFTISYHNSESEAIESINALSNFYTASNNETIYVRLENNISGCYDITQFSIVINPLPLVDIEDQVICLNNLPLLVSASTNNPTDTYLWSTNATTPEIEIFETGLYAVTVTNEFGCESINTFNVTESESATIDVVETINFSDPNNITVTVIGIGNYLYQLNNMPLQTSNIFVNVPIGYNTLTIIDQNGCGQITKEVLVIDLPKHLSPNNDGDFDTWHITGVETLPGTVIHIFDRYGKLLKELGHNTLGWDGTFNGNKMPAGDYWYVANVFQNGESFQVKGHFSLRR